MILENLEFDLVAVVVPAVITFIIGSLWYSPLLFGNIWGKLRGMDMSKKPEMGEMMPGYLATFIGTVVMAFGLLQFVLLLGIEEWQDGLELGLFVALVFVVAMQLGTAFFTDKSMEDSLKASLIDAGYNLVGYGVMGALIPVLL